MADKDQKLIEIQEKLDQLISSYEMCMEANSMLSSEIEEIKTRLDKRNAEYETLKERFETLKVARSIGDTPEGKKEARAKINAIVREVDQCIALLNR
ncbi:MAG TPA: hypothetical protein VJ937_10375 [Salinivirga sp.]|uniref:hypothetical protein n=1 Tax=Salinivirga sp. TaxID=1970192 RepID=UPI002B46F3F7|nr:hypothetical protein [Salinivirga sp.]HKK59873.1 hypothetical protein [Salinivirga sp.]